jgi:hypothetical protein
MEMSKHLHDDHTLTRYLLGWLPAAEAERLDELSVIDDELAESLRSVENDLIDAYVQGELDEAARAQFKTHYLASAMRRERLAFARAFQARAAQGLTLQATPALAEAPNIARTEASEAAPLKKGRNIFSAWHDFNVSRPAWARGAALAALVLVAVGGWFIYDSVRRHQQPAPTEARRAAPERQAPEARKEPAAQPAANAQPTDERAREDREPLAQGQTQNDRQRLAEQQRTAEHQRVERQPAADQKSPAARAGAVASFVLAPQLRGASQVQSISIPADADQVVMRLRLEPNEFTAYRVRLLDETGAHVLWRSGQLKARGVADSKTLSLNFRARLLRPQTAYVLRVTNDAGEIVDDYPFRVVK